jgi:hypothetical protein
MFRIGLAAVALSAIVAGGAFAASTGSAVPSSSAGAIRAAFAHGPGPWKVPIGADGRSKYSAWPNACQMLSLGVLKVLLPGTKAVKPVGQHGQLLTGGETPKFTHCAYDVHGAYDPPASDGYPPTHLDVDLRGVFDAAANKQEWTQEQTDQAKLAKKYPDQYALYKGPKGAACFWDGNELECMSGTWNFWVAGMFIDKTGDDSPALEKALRTKVLLPMAFGLASRMH